MSILVQNTEVENIIKKRWDGLKNPKELVSLYNIEKQTNQGYNGRQLLELFQNCEDEGATKVKIFLDSKNSLLEISNDGDKSFSIKGYESIFYPGLSSKVSSGYIGNKGLGFRSIINWADEITIISNNFKVVFNPTFNKGILLQQLGYTEVELNQIRKERKLNSDVYPIPLLNCCKIWNLETPHNYTTTISIKYKKDFEDKIIEQLKSISSKTLLFLHCIETIEIVGDILSDTISVTRKKISENTSEIIFNEEKFYVLNDEGIIDEELIDDKESSEPKRYSVKIAYNEDLSFKDTVLYNYFKTQIPFELPFVVHASLELDQNRNHSIESKVNPFVLNKLFQLHLKLIETLKKKYSKSWLPYQTINKDSFLVYKPYSDIIDEFWGTLEVYPTLLGNYYTLSEAKNLGNNLAEFIEENHKEECFGEQIVYCDLDINPQQYVDKPINYVEIIELIAQDLDFTQRAKLIALILESYPNEKFSVLINDSETLIKTNEFVYSEKTADNTDLIVPSYSKIRFLHPELHQALLVELQLDADKARTLKDKLELISDVHSFEPQTVLRKIVSETNDLLSNPKANNKAVMIEFYQTLFHNYLQRKVNPVFSYDARIPCFNQLGNIVDLKELTLSKEFQIGNLANTIFGNLYDENNTISNLVDLGLANKERDNVEEFLKWLGINHFSIIERKSSNIEGPYLKSIHQIFNVAIVSYFQFSVKKIDELFLNKNININQVIAWLSLDEGLQLIFSNYTQTHSTTEKLSYNYRGPKEIKSFFNYIYFSILTRFQISNFLITNKKSEWFNPFTIDYDLLKEINVKLDRTEIERILLFFGAKRDFNDLDIGFLKTKTEELASKNISKGAQFFYKSLVGHYKVNETKILNVSLFAKEGENIVVKDASEIYFSDRIQLPAYLTNKFPILYYPARSGGVAAIEMFGLRNLNDLDLKIKREVPNFHIASEFEKFIKEVRPFILAFRLDKITKEDVKKSQVQRLNKLKIICCMKLVCSIDDESFEIEPYNYIYSNDQFYINIPFVSTISHLQQSKPFIDNLSDIFLKVFDTLDEKKIFESILKQSKDDNLYDVNSELAEGILEEAKILLGEISIRLSIWRAIFKGNIPEFTIELNENNLEEYIYEYFPKLRNVKLFDSDDSLDEIKRIRNVFELLSIDLNSFNLISDYKLTFDSLYNKELIDYYDERKKNFKNQLWYRLKNGHIDEQSSFINYLFKIEHLLDKVILETNSTDYNFNQIILKELGAAIPLTIFELDGVDDYTDYDIIERENIKYFSKEELLIIRMHGRLNSLSYFKDHIDYIKAEVNKLNETKLVQESIDFSLNTSIKPELMEDFNIELSVPNIPFGSSNGPWLGESNELSPNSKKKLGTDVEVVIKEYLDSKPELYQNVEHVSKTNEGEHYDIKYFDINDEKIKYVECKYYNGLSFFISREEKNFADGKPQQYEIWLVNSDLKIFCIKDIRKLGELQPVNYKVNVKIKNYALEN